MTASAADNVADPCWSDIRSNVPVASAQPQEHVGDWLVQPDFHVLQNQPNRRPPVLPRTRRRTQNCTSSLHPRNFTALQVLSEISSFVTTKRVSLQLRWLTKFDCLSTLKCSTVRQIIDLIDDSLFKLPLRMLLCIDDLMFKRREPQYNFRTRNDDRL